MSNVVSESPAVITIGDESSTGVKNKIVHATKAVAGVSEDSENSTKGSSSENDPDTKSRILATVSSGIAIEDNDVMLYEHGLGSKHPSDDKNGNPESHNSTVGAPNSLPQDNLSLETVSEHTTEINEPDLTNELTSLIAERSTLKKQKMNEKDVRSLAKTLGECKTKAQDIKKDVVKVLEDRAGCEKECLQLEQSIGDKLAALTAEVHRSTKECVDKAEDMETLEVRTPIPLSTGSVSTSTGIPSRERRSSSKSATPPPVGVQPAAATINLIDRDRALQEKILHLSQQEQQPKKLSGSSKKKGVESILRSLGAFATTEEKLRALCELHLETLEQLRESQITAERWKKQVQAGQKESNRALLARDRLEGLCRELQKQNNAIKEESALRRREDEEKRKQMAARLQTTLNDISLVMADNQEMSTKLRQENSQLANKLQTLVNHYDLWEKHTESMLKHKSIEVEWTNAKLREAQLLRKKDSKEWQQARRVFEHAACEMRTQLETSLRNEIILREQLKLHTEKYEQFQQAIQSSNKMFSDFKGEFESMGKQTRKFEREAAQWQQRYKEANLATARVLQEKTKSDVKVETLARLCRLLQQRLHIDSKEISGLESSIGGQVVAEEKAKLESELAAKQQEITLQKRTLQEQDEKLKSESDREDGLKGTNKSDSALGNSLLDSGTADVAAEISTAPPHVTAGGLKCNQLSSAEAILPVKQETSVECSRTKESGKKKKQRKGKC